MQKNKFLFVVLIIMPNGKRGLLGGFEWKGAERLFAFEQICSGAGVRSQW